MPEYEKLLSAYNYAELRIVSGSESYVNIKDDEVRHSAGSYYGASVRVLEAGSWGFASSSKEGIEALLTKARKLATLNSGKIELSLPPAERKHVMERIKPYDEETQVKDLAGLSKDMKAENVTSRIVSFMEGSAVKEFYSSHGSAITQETGYSFLSCSCIAREGNVIQRGSSRTSSRKGFAALELEKTGQEAKEKALRLLKASAPPKGRFTVVLDPEMTGVFSHEALGHACEADSVLERESILADKIGKKIGSELVTIIDDPTADDFGGYAYDDEGVAARPVTLIEKGVLRGFMDSMETARALKLGLNGHARAQGYSEIPVVRMGNTYFQRGSSTFDDVFEVKEGIYLRGVKGGSVDIFSGGFMFKAEEAYEIKNSESTKLLRDVMISGDILQTMLDVECVGDDFGTSPGICGKFSQDVPVSDGGPHIRVRNVAIG